jgi:(2Fe-2S) ferredoxin
MALVFPDWKVCLEVENSPEGAKALWDGALSGTLGRAGRLLQNEGQGVERRRSWVLPYRAIVLLCSHKNRDKRCHIAAGLLRPALIGCLERNGVTVDEVGMSLARLDGPPLEELVGTDAEREAEVGRRIENIEGVHGGEGGEVGVFNINHLGGHRYAGVMLILFPSGAYLSYGRVSPHEIPRVVEETILQGKVVPGLIRSGAGLARPGAANKDKGFLSW